jgi:hypothetical protein
MSLSHRQHHRIDNIIASTTSSHRQHHRIDNIIASTTSSHEHGARTESPSAPARCRCSSASRFDRLDFKVSSSDRAARRSVSERFSDASSSDASRCDRCSCGDARATRALRVTIEATHRCYFSPLAHSHTERTRHGSTSTTHQCGRAREDEWETKRECRHTGRRHRWRPRRRRHTSALAAVSAASLSAERSRMLAAARCFSSAAEDSAALIRSLAAVRDSRSCRPSFVLVVSISRAI